MAFIKRNKSAEVLLSFCMLTFLIIQTENSYCQNNSFSLLTRANSIEESYYALISEDQYISVQDSISLELQLPSLENLQENQWRSIFNLNELQISDIKAYVKRYGQLLSIYEFKFIESMDSLTLSKIALLSNKYGTIQESVISISRAMKYLKHETIIRFDIKKNFSESDLENTSTNTGMPGRSILRYKMNACNKIIAGITAETDAGEKAGLPDYFSFFAMIKNVGIMKKIIVGDFNVGFGQGLTVNTSTSIGKIAGNLLVQKYLQGVRPHTSTVESGFLRGIGAEINLSSQLSTTLFFSSKGMDGRITEYDSVKQQILSCSINNASGLHRNESEITGKNLLKSLTTGGQFKFRSNKFQVTIHAIYSKFSFPIKKLTTNYNQYHFSGSESMVSGLAVRYIANRINFFNEFSFNKALNWGFIQGVSSQLSPRLFFIGVFRHYQKGFQSLFGSSFGESSSLSNETGLFMGINLKLSKLITLNLTSDQYLFSWLSYGSNAPSKGSEYQINIALAPVKSTAIKLMYKFKTEESTQYASQNLFPTVFNKTQHRIRFSLKQNIMMVELRNRVEWRLISSENTYSQGFLALQDIIIKPSLIPLQLYFRYLLYDTDDYNSRVYAFENDVLYSFQVPAFYGKGNRVYFLLKYTLFSQLDTWIKVGLDTKRDQTINLSTNHLFTSSRNLDLKLQVRFKL